MGMYIADEDVCQLIRHKARHHGLNHNVALESALRAATDLQKSPWNTEGQELLQRIDDLVAHEELVGSDD